jgi:hypothetical protein
MEKPKNLMECFKILDKELPENSKLEFKINNSGYSILQHFGTGMWIRNQFGLWDDESPLRKFFSKKIPYSHPDDLSGLILTAYGHYLNNEISDFENCIFAYNDIYNNLDEYYLDRIKQQKLSLKFHKKYSKDKPSNFVKLYKHKNNKFLLRTYFRDCDYVVVRKKNKELADVKIVKRNKKDCKWESSIDTVGIDKNNKYYSLKADGKTWEESFDNLIKEIKRITSKKESN